MGLEGRCRELADFYLYDVIEHVRALAAVAARRGDLSS
jgi:hypothetical protein